ncbi:MAG: hypothetical protein DHS20C07_19240 [Methyloligella sp.]|nr:MAG: hypothetical protein DHS20C07_19240 [Methyloligella sp.]
MATELKRVNGTLPSREIEKQTTELRRAGIIYRKNLTDAVQMFNGYVDSEGKASTRPKWAYKNITTKIYAKRNLNVEMVDARYAGKVGRDVVSDDDLNFIQAAENLVTNLLLTGMQSGKTRKKIKEIINIRITKLAEAHRVDDMGDAA